MDAGAEQQRAKENLAICLAGLEGGTVGILWMLAWLGVSAVWQQRSFWTAENLMATAFDRNSTLAPVFNWGTCGGLALYVVMYSALGAIFATLVRHRVPRNRIMLLAVVFALAWYYLSFRWAFQFALPLVALLHVEHATLVGHLLYGTMLGRYPMYVARLMGATPPEPAPAPAAIAEAAPVAEVAAVEAPAAAQEESAAESPGA